MKRGSWFSCGLLGFLLVAVSLAGPTRAHDVASRPPPRDPATLLENKSWDTMTPQERLICQLVTGNPADPDRAARLEQLGPAGVPVIIDDLQASAEAADKAKLAYRRGYLNVLAEMTTRFSREVDRSSGALAGRARESLGYLAQALMAAEAVPDGGEKSSWLSRIAEAQTKASFLAAAIATTGKPIAELLTDRSLSELISQLAGAGDIAGALVLVDALKDESSKSYARVSIAYAQAGRGDIAGAKVTTDAIPAGGNKVEGLRVIALAQARSGDPAGARQTFSRDRVMALAMPEGVPFANSKAMELFHLAIWQAKAGDVAGARATAEAILDRG